MEKETDDILCDVCCDSPATIVECLEGNDTDLCSDCADDLPCDEWTGELVREIYGNVDGLPISQTTYEEETSCCDWSGERTFNENLIHLSCGDRIHRENHEDEIFYCHDCDYIGHMDDGNYVEDSDIYVCSDCEEQHHVSRHDRWYSRFSKIVSNAFSRYPVRNYVGIEFEAEYGEPIEDSMSTKLRRTLAEAKDDGSLDNGGTEYVTHPIRGNDVADTVDEMCQLFSDYSFDMSGNVGWHFHYEMEGFSLQRQKNVWKAMQRFDNLIRMAPEEYRYFAEMQRSYACGWTDSYVAWAGQWAMNKKTKHNYQQHRGIATRGSEMGRYAWLNWSPMAGNENRRIEIRLYRPVTFRQNFTSFRGWNRDAYKQTGDDYKTFIQFWNEFIRKAAYRPRSLKFRDDSHGLIEMDEFAGQFSPQVMDWLKTNYNYTHDDTQGGDTNV